jgi:hypothetical protein
MLTFRSSPRHITVGRSLLTASLIHTLLLFISPTSHVLLVFLHGYRPEDDIEYALHVVFGSTTFNM